MDIGEKRKMKEFKILENAKNYNRKDKMKE